MQLGHATTLEPQTNTIVSTTKTALQNAKSPVFVAYLDPEIHANKDLSFFSGSKVVASEAMQDETSQSVHGCI